MDGTVRLWSTPADPAAPFLEGGPIGKALAADERNVVDWAGLKIRGAGSPFNSSVVAIPLWLSLLVAAALAVPWVKEQARWARSLMNVHGTCTVCSYDLTGNTSGVCPECGTAVRDVAGSMAENPNLVT